MRKTIFLILPLLAIGLIPALAQEIPDVTPEPSSCFATISASHWLYQCVWKYPIEKPIPQEIIKDVIIQYENEPIESFFQRMTEQILSFTAEPEITDPEPEREKPVPEVRFEGDTFIDERHGIIEKILKCRYGVGSFKPIQQDSEFIIPAQELHQDNIPLSSNVKLRDLIKAYEACEIMKKYAPYMLRQYDDIIVESLLDKPLKTLDMTDSIYTDPVTPRDIKDAEEKALRLIDESPWLKLTEPTDPNRGGYTEGAKCHPRPPAVNAYGELERASYQMCPQLERNAYLSGADSTEQSGLEKYCTRTLRQYGDAQETSWPYTLKSTPCPAVLGYEPIVDELWKGQTAVNCPDCKRFMD